MSASRPRLKSFTIKRARNVSMPCGRRRWNWAGANPQSAPWTAIWEYRGHKRQGVRISRPWWRMFRWGKWEPCLHWKFHGWHDPADFNDGLLLGLKGTMAQAELHFLRGRLLGGKLNKAKKGELRFPLPVGFCYDEEGRTILDPDEEVRGAVALVFRLFRETGSAYG